MKTSLTSFMPGARCRATRTIVFPGGIVRRATPGTLISQRRNLGRDLFTVELDSGQRVILFAHEIEAVGDQRADPAARSDRHPDDAVRSFGEQSVGP